jgi:hypothetical protein
MHHYTITTGHCRQSPRSEVSAAAIAVLTPLLRDGEHWLPAPFASYRLRITVAGSTLAATVLSHVAGPLVTVLVCLDDVGLAQALRTTGAIAAVPLHAPAVLVELHPALSRDPDAAGWLGDFERCLGWAWQLAAAPADK